MRLRRTLIAAVVAVAVAAALSGCAAQVAEFSEAMEATSTPAPLPSVSEPRVNELEDSGGWAPRTTVFEQELPAGRTVLCVSTDGYHESSLSCDWDHVDGPPIKAAG